MRACVDERTAKQIREYNQRRQDEHKRRKAEARRKIEDRELAKEVGLDYEEVKDL